MRRLEGGRDRSWGGLVAAVAVAAVTAPGAEAVAVPVFARGYQTSCQTCHSAFPKLTPFGEAFRRNGYRFPAGEEGDAVKLEPVALGQQAHKKVFPGAVWPGEAPGYAPLSVQVASQAAYLPGQAAQASFAGLGANLGLNAAATLGDGVAVWAGAWLRAGAAAQGGEALRAEIERIFVVFTPFDAPVATLRVGRFEPGVLGPSVHRTFGSAPWIGTSAVGDNRFSLEPAQLGLEATGVVAGGRLAWGTGLVEGAGSLPDTAKDFYGRVAYKLGGMRLDGVGAATDPEPWREKSLVVGAFGYRGQALLGDPATATQIDRFVLAGADLSLTFGDANLQVAGALGANARPLLADPGASLQSRHLFGQLDYVVFPWLIPTARWERRSLAESSRDRLSGGVYFLVRANVRAQLLATAEGSHGDLHFGQLTGGLNLAL